MIGSALTGKGGMVMADREKVIKEFELFIKGFHPACTSEGVELDMLREVLTLLKDQEDLGEELTNAVELIHKKNKRIEELLKEQEAVKPTINEYGEAYCICGENVGIIPNSKNLPKIRSKYCSECGRRMKWDA